MSRRSSPFSERIVILKPAPFYLVRPSCLSQIAVSALFLALTACGVIKDRSGEYTLAEEGRDLQIPEGYDGSTIRTLYVIPPSDSKNLLAGGFKLPEPPDATAVQNEAPFLVEREDEEGLTWLHLYSAPGKVWPLLDYFWTQNGIKVQHEEIANGFVVTETVSAPVQLLAQKLPPAQVDQLLGKRMQASLHQGVRRNTAELQLRVLDAGVDPAVYQSWQKESRYVELEQSMLNVLGEFITSDALENRYSLLANDIGGESRVRMMKDDVDSSYLEMNLSYARAWSEVNDALEASGVLIADLDRVERFFLISYLGEDDITHWYDFWGGAESKRMEQNFALRLSVNEKGMVIVRVEQLNPDLDSDLKQELLNLVFEHIS